MISPSMNLVRFRFSQTPTSAFAAFYAIEAVLRFIDEQITQSGWVRHVLEVFNLY